MAREDRGRGLDLARFRRDLGDYPAELGNLVLAATLDSTNTLARRVAETYLEEALTPPAALFLALHQSAGRGRLGRRWQSPAGEGVYASLLRPLGEGEDPALYPLLVGVGLCAGLDRWLAGRCRLKWPNDLVIGGRKLGGILIESLAGAERPLLVIGFGVNLGRPAEPAAGVTGLRDETAAAPSLGELAAELLRGVAREIARSRDPAGVVEAYRERSAHRAGDRLRCLTAKGLVEGRFLGFDRRGLLRLDTGGGERLLAAADLIE